MKSVDIFTFTKEVPFIHHRIIVNTEGQLFSEDVEITLNEFNSLTGLTIDSPDTLVAISFHGFNWPPAYWNTLNVMRYKESIVSPENLVIGISGPVESLEFPGFYMIPYFSNYVISKDGILLKKSSGVKIEASKGVGGYYTYRMTDDSGRTQNRYRHRILGYAFKPYPVNVDELDINHDNGKPGNDWLDNLEWSTRSENNLHAVNTGLRNDNLDVEVRNVQTGRRHLFGSCTQAADILGVTPATVCNRARSNGYKLYGGMQYRFYPSTEEWPTVEPVGDFVAEFQDGARKRCDGVEAARLAGVSRTSLLRLLREGRNTGKSNVKIFRC